MIRKALHLYLLLFILIRILLVWDSNWNNIFNHQITMTNMISKSDWGLKKKSEIHVLLLS